MAKRRAAISGAHGKGCGGQGSRARRRSTHDVPELPLELLEQRFPGGFTLRDEANSIVAWALRNGPLEDLHARITDGEMKALMLHACERVEALLRLKQEDPKKYDSLIKGYNVFYCGQWKR